MTSDHRVTPGLIHDILDALERHGYYRSDDLHADRAIGLIGDLAGIYEGTQDHPAYPFMVPPSLPAYPGPSRDGAVTLTRDDAITVFAAADIAADDKRYRVEMCPDCADRSCPDCQTHLHDIRAFDQMADRMLQAAQAAPAASASRPGARSPGPARRRPGGRPVTPSRRKPDEPARRPAATPPIPGPRSGERDVPETAEPYDLPFPDHWPPGRPEYVIVVDQLRGWRPDLPPSLAELLEAGPARTRRTRTRPGSRTMTLTINDTAMTSDQTAHTARLAPGSQHLWEVSWLPGRALDRNSAITAMTLADLRRRS